MHEDAEPLDDDGYATWKEAFGRGEAGVFTISVAEAVEVMEAALRE